MCRQGKKKKGSCVCGVFFLSLFFVGKRGGGGCLGLLFLVGWGRGGFGLHGFGLK